MLLHFGQKNFQKIKKAAFKKINFEFLEVVFLSKNFF